MLESEKRVKWWYDTYVTNVGGESDKQMKKDIHDFGSLTSEKLRQNLHVSVDSKMCVALFDHILEAITAYLKKQQDKSPSYYLMFLNKLMIGYSNPEENDDEKGGNFVIHMKQVPGTKKETFKSSFRDAEEIISEWSARNLQTDEESENLKIMDEARTFIKEELNIALGHHELVYAIFINAYDALCECLQTKRQEHNVSDYYLNIAGWIDVHCTELEDGGDFIFFKMSPSMKQDMKSDLKSNKDEID